MEEISLSDVKNIDDFKNYLMPLEPHIGCFGGRYYKSRHANNPTLVTLNDIVRTFDKIIQSNSECENEKKTYQIKEIIRGIRRLDNDGDQRLNNANILRRIITYARQFFGNLCFNREAILDKIEFPGKTLATSRKNYRLLLLKGEEGSVACRVRGISAKTFPTISQGGTIECGLRSWARLRNLIAVRGKASGARMVGPCDYYGNLEKPHKYEYTIEIEDGIPLFLRQKKMGAKGKTSDRNFVPVDIKAFTTEVEAKWHKGTNANIREIQNKYIQEGKPVSGESLFPNSGILEIREDSPIQLKSFDARTVDLSPFKARLVDNKTPFQITSDQLPSVDEYRAVSYFYESGYADKQVENGGGLFLETHGFSQTMTPLDPNARGFVTLARWTSDQREKLELIAVKIPFGHTLIIDKECIHGDTNLDGMFMMCMTSNHVTMQTADCVFLKSPKTGKNISIELQNDTPHLAPGSAVSAPLPFAVYNNGPREDKETFKRTLASNSMILNPSSIFA